MQAKLFGIEAVGWLVARIHSGMACMSFFCKWVKNRLATRGTSGSDVDDCIEHSFSIQSCVG